MGRCALISSGRFGGGPGLDLLRAFVLPSVALQCFPACAVAPAADPVASGPPTTPAPTPPTCDDWREWEFFRSASADLVRGCLQAGADVNAPVADGQTILHRAASWADGTVVAVLLQAGAEVDARDDDGETPLHLAAGNRNMAAVTTLLGAGADVHARDHWHRTPLHDAAGHDGAEIVNALLDAGADVNAGAGGYSGTPLMAAVWARATISETVNALLDAGADVNLGSSNGDTPLLRTMISRPRPDEHDELLLKLLALGADPNARGGGGVTPLYAATRTVADGPQFIRALLEAGADPRTLTDDGASPLHAAARARLASTPEVITMLADLGLDVNGRDGTGQTPLHKARAYNNLPAIRKLLELGADPDARDSAGRIADPVCHWEGGGVPAGSPAESVRGCLESGVSVDARHEEGATSLALWISSRTCCADLENVLREFVAAGADVNARDDVGRTPLHRASHAWVPNIAISALLGVGADPGARDLAGSTPLHDVAGRGWNHQVSVLVAAGADVNARDNRGRTPLHVTYDHATIRTLLRLGADPAARDSAGTAADPVACEHWGRGAFFAFANADIVAGCLAAGVEGHAIADGSRATALLLIAAGSTPDPAIVAMLLEAGADVHARDDLWEETPLHRAAESGTPQVVRALLEAGADVDAWAMGHTADYRGGWTPLHLAARSNPDPDVVRALLDAGAELQARSGESYHWDNSPLHYAGGNPNPAVAAALLDAGADINALSHSGRTPLHEAAANASDPAVIELLVAAGGDVNALDSQGCAPLHSAAWYNPRPEITTALIAAGADVNARDPDGHVPPGRAANDQTPLFMALYRGGNFIGGQPMPSEHSVAVAEALVRAGANLERVDGTDRTALHIAARWTPAAFPLLLRLGADSNARDAYGRTPWDYALRNRALEGLPEVRRMREEMRRRGAER